MKTNVKITYELPDGTRKHLTADSGVAFDVARAIAKRIGDQVFLHGNFGNAAVRADGTGHYSFYADKAKITHDLATNCFPCI